MIWLQFAGSTIILVIAAVRLAEYGDVIALRTGLGGMFVGTLLLAGATSLPELLTSISAINEGVPNLTVGNIFGSNMFNIFLLAVLDLLYWRKRMLRRLGLIHALSAAIAVGSVGLAMFFILAQIDIQVGWVGLDSLVLIATYLIGTRLLFGGGQSAEPPSTAAQAPGLENVPGLPRSVLGFGIATLVLVIVTPLLVRSSAQIAEETGLSTGFVGIALLGVITSLPEVVATLSAARLGAYDLAAGNLFGSTGFNIFILGVTDFFYTDGRFLEAVSADMILAGIIALLLAHVALLGNLIRNLSARETRRLVIEVDSLIIISLYFIGMIIIYSKGLL